LNKLDFNFIKAGTNITCDSPSANFIAYFWHNGFILYRFINSINPFLLKDGEWAMVNGE
jgi:hypothetical protein